MKAFLTVLEGKWAPKTDLSVRDIFRPMFSVWSSDGGQSIHYEQFTTEDAFRAAIRHAFMGHQPATIYVGAHGDHRKIYGFHDEGISQTVIKNSFKSIRGSTKRGVYFGACSFCHWGTAETFLGECERVLWMAGYDKDVDWIDSCALDLVFFRHFLFPQPGRGNPRPRSPEARLKYAVGRVRTDMPSLAERLGFHVFFRKHRRIIDLITVE